MDKVVLYIHATPKGSKNSFVGWRDNVLCIKITAPPVDGAANMAIIKFLSKELKVKKSDIIMVSGEKSREKCFEINGITEYYVKSIFI